MWSQFRRLEAQVKVSAGPRPLKPLSLTCSLQRVRLVAPGGTHWTPAAVAAQGSYAKQGHGSDQVTILLTPSVPYCSAVGGSK